MKIIEANGAHIPAIGLGTWDLRGDQGAEIVSTAIGKGYRHVDTAIYYDNEQQVGEGIRNSGIGRNEIFLTTKVWPDQIADGKFQTAVEGSLKRLDVDAVNLLLIHWPPNTGDEKIWAGLLDLAVKEGWTKHVGVSNFNVPQMDAMMTTLDNPLVCNQVENHPYLDQSAIRQSCEKHGMAMIAYCPLFRGGELFEEEVVATTAQNHDKTPAQVVLRWHVQHQNGGAIPKTATPSRLDENKDVFDFELSQAEMAAISALGFRREFLCEWEWSPPGLRSKDV